MEEARQPGSGPLLYRGCARYSGGEWYSMWDLNPPSLLTTPCYLAVLRCGQRSTPPLGVRPATGSGYPPDGLTSVGGSVWLGVGGGRTLVIGGSRYPGAVSADGWRQRSTLPLRGSRARFGQLSSSMYKATTPRAKSSQDRTTGYPAAKALQALQQRRRNLEALSAYFAIS